MTFLWTEYLINKTPFLQPPVSAAQVSLRKIKIPCSPNVNKLNLFKISKDNHFCSMHYYLKT